MSKQGKPDRKPSQRPERFRKSSDQKKPAAGDSKAGRGRPNPTQHETRSKPKG
jgi:hypothetical protein